jgi:hypothetical protein
VQAWTSLGSLRPCTSSDASPTMVGSAVRKCEGMCSSYQYCSLYGMLPKSNYLPEHCFAPRSAARFYPLQARISLNSQTRPAVAGLKQCELSSCLSADRSERNLQPGTHGGTTWVATKNARCRDSRKATVFPVKYFFNMIAWRPSEGSYF